GDRPPIGRAENDPMSITYEMLGENACLLRLGETVDPAINARVHALAERLRAANIEGLQDVVPAYASLLLRHGLSDPAAVAQWHQRIQDVAASLTDHDFAERPARHDIPVYYGGELGEDLEQVA